MKARGHDRTSVILGRNRLTPPTAPEGTLGGSFPQRLTSTKVAGPCPFTRFPSPRTDVPDCPMQAMALIQLEEPAEDVSAPELTM